MSSVQQDVWTQCYGDGWQGLIVPEAFSHPAKFSRSLIQRIYAHAREEGWLTPGAWILDPFSGVSLGACDALLAGYNVLHCELEPRFHELAKQNLALWQRRYGHLPGYGQVVLVQGDSRQLYALVERQAAMVCSSPPYAGAGEVLGAHNGIDWTKTQGTGQRLTPGRTMQPYGTTEGQLGAMPVQEVSAVIGSPPFGDSLPCGETAADMKQRWGVSQLGGAWGQHYGDTPGNLGNLTTGAVEVVVSRPPFGAASTGGGIAAAMRGEGSYPLATTLPANCYQPSEQGTSQGNLANDKADTFWSAARTILEQAYALVQPGGHAVWVVKHYVRDRKLVDFPGDWRRLCEAVGFITLHEHRAMLVEDHGRQASFFGGDTQYRTERKSFFRRLAEKNGSPPIDYEMVLCMAKPGGLTR